MTSVRPTPTSTTAADECEIRRWSVLLPRHIRPGCQKLQTRVYVAKKRVRQPPHIAAAPGGTGVFFLHDPITGIRFLVDTGAGRSLLPASQWRKSHQPNPDVRLTAANGTPIPTYGRHHLDIRIGNRKYGWSFVVADVTLPLLGADFLANYQLHVDVARAQLVDTASLAATPIAAAPGDLAIQVIDASDDFAHLRDSYPDVFSRSFVSNHRIQSNTEYTTTLKHRVLQCFSDFVG